MAGNQGNNRIVWQDWQLEYLKDNWQQLNSRELSEALGITRTKVREKLYEWGFKKMELEYWTEEQVSFLLDHFRDYGDTELAEMFTERWHKDKGWTKKHIEKKRRYLNLKRTNEEKKLIHARNVELGKFAMCATHMWKTRGVSPNGTRRMWEVSSGNIVEVIKIAGYYVHYARWLYEQIFGPIPPKYMVRLKDGDHFNVTPSNLILVSMAENATINSTNRLPKDLREIIQLNNKLKKAIHDKSGKNAAAAPEC